MKWVRWLWMCVTCAPLLAQEPKLDTDLREFDGQLAVFVRMEDQRFGGAGDYERFCAEHPTTPRSKLRADVVADLKQRAASSWERVAAEVGKLTAAGELRSIARYWIVNGFAAAASADACAALAALPGVSFVYRQREPNGGAQHAVAPRERVEALQPARRAELERALALIPESEPAFDADGLTVPWNLKRIHADVAWQSGAHGQGVVVALMDSGLLVMPSLAQALWRNPREQLDGEDEDGNGYVDDVVGWDFLADSPHCVGDGAMSHGSMCGGIVAGRPWGEPKTVTGVAPRARLMMLRGMGRLRAYEYAIDAGADVVSMSYMWVNVELGNYRGVFRVAHEHMAACGLVAVGGAGNFRRSAPAGRQIALPKDIPCVIAAAGILENGEQSPMSSEGPCTWDDVRFYRDYPKEAPLVKPDVTALFRDFPLWHRTEVRGRQVEVVWQGPDGFGLITGPGGNSFAGPHAAGVAALMLSVQPELTPWRVQELMCATCKDLGEPGKDVKFGAGLLQADAAVAAARGAKVE